jgi:hypothetical protein
MLVAEWVMIVGLGIHLRWQEDRAVAAGIRSRGCRGRKVRTPQGSVPDNVRDVSFKAHRRPVPQKRYRLGYPSLFRDGREFPEGLKGFAWRAGPRWGKGEKVR